MSREGVQRDLLPLIEGNDRVHQIRAGEDGPRAVHRLGRVPSGQAVGPAAGIAGAVCRSGWNWHRCRAADLRQILVEPEHSLLKQYGALMQTEGVSLDLRRGRHRRAWRIWPPTSTTGWRTSAPGGLATVLEKLLEEVSFTASDRSGETVTVDAAYVNERVAPLAARGDLSRFIL